MKARRQNITQHCQIADLCHCAIFIGKFKQIEVGIRHHDITGLTTDPAPHVDIAIGTAGALVIDVQTNAGMAFLAGATATAGDIERHRYQVTDIEKLDILALFDDLAGDLVP